MTAKPSFVYFIYAESRIKIGKTNDVWRRFGILQVGSPIQLQLMGFVPGDMKLERALHKHFAKYRLIGEWFDATPAVVKWVEDYIAEHRVI